MLRELAHSYLGHESLTQFLELYLYNRRQTGSIAVEDWPHTRGYQAGNPENAGVRAIHDIYRILGHEPWRRPSTPSTG